MWQLPQGVLNWCCELELTDYQIRTALTFAHKCCTSTFDKVFQYKIVTQILPTNEYLFRYKVKNSSSCDRCLVETDTIVHRLYECEFVVQIVSSFLNFLYSECDQPRDIKMVDYLFGLGGIKNMATNQILLELKKMIFYSSPEEISNGAFCDRFKNNIIILIIKEKCLLSNSGEFESFYTKWENFTSIYDFRGPDNSFL